MYLKGKIVMSGYTQKMISRMIGISEHTLSKKINNRATFNTEEVEMLCDLLGITRNEEKIRIFLRQSSQKRDIFSRQLIR